jgi:ClpP class serine protease
MKFPKLLETLTRSPLLMTPGAVESILTLFENHATMSREDFQAAREGKDVCGGKVDLEQMSIEDGIAMIPVKGPLGVGLDSFEKGAGCTDYADIIRDIAEANDNPKVENIVGIFDTPGGTWGGLLECAQAISDSEKPFYVFVPPGGSVASAGMFLAACAAGRFLSPSAQAGSIGVYCAYMDTSARAEAMGVKVKVFTSGKFKGQGIPGTSLSAEQEEHLQDHVMELAQEFYDHMRANLGDIPDDAMQGQMFRAQQAVQLGFADDVVSSFDQLKSYLR